MTAALKNSRRSRIKKDNSFDTVTLLENQKEATSKLEFEKRNSSSSWESIRRKGERTLDVAAAALCERKRKRERERGRQRESARNRSAWTDTARESKDGNTVEKEP